MSFGAWAEPLYIEPDESGTPKSTMSASLMEKQLFQAILILPLKKERRSFFKFFLFPFIQWIPSGKNGKSTAGKNS